MPRCDKTQIGGSPYCQAHGGGRDCRVADCLTAREAGGTGCCWAHGGGKRCGIWPVGEAGGICRSKPVAGSEPARCRTHLGVMHRGGEQYEQCAGAASCTRTPVRGTVLCRQHTPKPGEQYPDPEYGEQD
jgi:hypothetical protein